MACAGADDGAGAGPGNGVAPFTPNDANALDALTLDDPNLEAGGDPGDEADPGGSAAAGTEGTVEPGRDMVQPGPIAIDPSAPAEDGAGVDDPSGTPDGTQPEATPSGPAPDVSDRGFDIDGTCFRGCSSDATDADTSGAEDGFGFENNASCVVGERAPALAALPCDPDVVVPPVNTDPNGVFIRDPRGVCPPDDQITCPLGLPRAECGCFIIPGLGARKAEVLNAAVSGGAVPIDFLASGSFESETYNTDYPFGDVFPDGRQKTGGAANFGIAKMNWTMIRRCHPAYAGLTDANFQRGAEINDDLLLEATIYGECRAFFGQSWLGGHRNGSAGLQNPNTPDVQRFVGVYEWLGEVYSDGHLTDDTRWYTNVPAI